MNPLTEHLIIQLIVHLAVYFSVKFNQTIIRYELFTLFTSGTFRNFNHSLTLCIKTHVCAIFFLIKHTPSSLLVFNLKCLADADKTIKVDLHVK